MSKNKITMVASLAVLITAVAVAPVKYAGAEDAASASYQMRLAALEIQVGAANDTAAQAVDPDQPRPIKMKLRRHYKKASKAASADKAEFDDDVVSTETSKNN